MVPTLFQDANILFAIDIFLRAAYKGSFATNDLANMYDFSRSETPVFVVGRLNSMFGIAQRSAEERQSIPSFLLETFHDIGPYVEVRNYCLSNIKIFIKI